MHNKPRAKKTQSGPFKNYKCMQFSPGTVYAGVMQIIKTAPLWCSQYSSPLADFYFAEKSKKGGHVRICGYDSFEVLFNTIMAVLYVSKFGFHYV